MINKYIRYSLAVVSALLLTMTSSGIVVAAVSPGFGDARIKSWSKDYLAGNREAVLKSVEKDLRSGDSHPYSAYIWTRIHQNYNDLEEAVKSISDEAVERALGPLPGITIQVAKKQCRQLLNEYPVSSLGNVSDPWVYDALATAAAQCGDQPRVAAYLVQGLKRNPSEFNLLWNLDNGSREADATWQAAMKLRNDLVGTPTADFIGALVPIRSSPALDRIAAAEKWLEKFPDDAWAKRFLSNAYYDAGFFDKAATPRVDGTLGFPFVISGNVAKVLSKVSRFDKAKNEMKKLTDAAFSKQEVGPKGAVYLARGMRWSGWKGHARKVLDAALKQWPDHAELNYEYAVLESSTIKREPHAVAYIRKARQAAPENLTYRDYMIDVLNSAGLLNEATEQCYTLLSDPEGFVDRELYGRCLDVYNKYGDHEASLKLATRALIDYPMSESLQMKKAMALYEAGSKDKSLKLIESLYRLNPNNLSALSYIVEKFNKKTAENLLAKLATTFPWQEAIWSKREGLATGGEVKKAIWKRAAKANPKRIFPLAKELDVLVDQKKWQMALKLAAHMTALPEYATRYDRKRAWLNQVWLYTKLSDKNEEILVDFRRAVEDFKGAGASPYDYHRYLRDFYIANGKPMKAAEEAFIISNITHGSTFPGILGTEAYSTYGRRFAAAQHMKIARDPYNGRVLSNVAGLHQNWIGGSIVVLELEKLIKERSPSFWRKKTVDRALASLGATGSVEDRYRRTSVGEGKRWIDWFASDRKQAQQEGKIITPGSEPYTVRIRDERGFITIRGEHPVTGAPTLIKRGAAWVRAGYDPNSYELTSVSTSNGKEIRLIYNEKRNISRMERDNGEVLLFTYNDIGKPIKIVMENVGSIDVTYDESGEISSVNSSEGHRMALKVTQAFQSLLSLTKSISGGQLERVSSFAVKSDELEGLESDFQKVIDKQGNVMRSGLKLAAYLVEHLADHPRNAGLAEDLIDQLFVNTVSGEITAKPSEKAKLIGLKYDLFLVTRPDGLPEDDFSEWMQWVSHLNSLPSGKVRELALDHINAEPLQLFPEARWLVQSDLSNPGYWRRFGRNALLPEQVRKARLQTILARSNGDVVLGTNKGISIFHRGFWHWYGIDSSQSMLSDTLETSSLGRESNIHALAETDDALWIGTEAGLYRIANLSEKGKHWLPMIGKRQALMVLDLVPDGLGIVAVTDKGLIRYEGEQQTQVWALKKGEVLDAAISSGEQFEATVTATSGLFQIKGDKWSRISKEHFDSVALYPGENEYVYLQQGRKVYRLRSGEKGAKPKLIPGASQIVANQKIHGLGELNLNNVSGLAIYTDQGLSVFRDEHVEHSKLEFGLTDRTPDVQAMSSANGNLFLITEREVLGFEKGNVFQRSEGRVSRILTQPATGLTYFIEGKTLQVVLHDNTADGTPEIAEVYSGYCNDIELDADGALIFNDGFSVLKMEPGSTAPIELFDARPSNPQEDELASRSLNDLLVARDGTIWAVTSQAVFSYKDGVKEEYNWFIDPKRFPFVNDMLYRMIETMDGELLVMVSDEGHLSYKGKDKVGGVARFNGKVFVKTERPKDGWFITGYTMITKAAAIVSTTDGFFRDRAGQYSAFSKLNDASYKFLQGEYPALYLGTDGVKLGEDTWLFGSASGIVARHRGRWFYPDRINRMLPEDNKYANRGGRTVHDLAIDSEGRIYAGTDIGLMVYSGGDSEGILFLSANLSQEATLEEVERKKLVQQRDSYIASLPAASEAAKDVRNYTEIKEQITHLESQLNPGEAMIAARKPEGEKMSIKVKNKLRNDLRQRQRNARMLLASLQSRNPSLYQMLEVKPFDLQALRSHLEEGQLVVQLIPLKNKLVIHLVSRDDFQVREIDGVDVNALMQSSVRTRALLELRSKETRGAASMQMRGHSTGGFSDAQQQELNGALSWLYDAILFPVEADLQAARQVFFVAPGALNYIPFAALKKTYANGKTIHAVEYFADTSFGYLPTLYMFQLATGDIDSGGGDHHLVVGNPSGDLPGAEAEAKAIADQLDGDVVLLTGNEAVIDEISSSIDHAQFVHIAAHGILDSEQPYASYLKLANGQRLDMYRVMELPLNATDLVVLSACDSGRGQSGQEYATLAWSFAHAGVPTIIASLWQVPDNPTRQLMEYYYTALKQGGDTLTSLASAQRSMIEQYPNNPSTWAGFVPFGRP